MRDLAVLFVHLIATVATLLARGGARSVVAESLLLKHQLSILNRSRTRAPNLRLIDRVIAGLCTGLMRPSRLLRSAIVLKPATIMAFHRALVKRKYRLLFTPRQHRKPGPKGPARELITAIVEMKRRNPRFCCRRIAQQLSFIFGVEINKDVVRRVLTRRYRPEPGSQGPSWLTFLGHSKDGLWSVDLFCCESLILRTHWVLVRVPSLEGESAHSRRDGDQDGTRGAAIASVHRTIGRHDTARASGSSPFLERRRSRPEAVALQGLLQPRSSSCVVARRHSGLQSRRCQSQDCQPQQVSVAASLPRLVSATPGCVTRNSPQTGVFC